MSASPAAPLPRHGEVFFDVRGDSRSMRLSWYADTGVAVFSIWQAGSCTSTFRLPITDLPRMMDILAAGPPPAAAPADDPALTARTGQYDPRRYDAGGYDPGLHDPRRPDRDLSGLGRHDPGFDDPGRYDGGLAAGAGYPADGRYGAPGYPHHARHGPADASHWPADASESAGWAAAVPQERSGYLPLPYSDLPRDEHDNGRDGSRGYGPAATGNPGPAGYADGGDTVPGDGGSGPQHARQYSAPDFGRPGPSGFGGRERGFMPGAEPPAAHGEPAGPAADQTEPHGPYPATDYRPPVPGYQPAARGSHAASGYPAASGDQSSRYRDYDPAAPAGDFPGRDGPAENRGYPHYRAPAQRYQLPALEPPAEIPEPPGSQSPDGDFPTDQDYYAHATGPRS